VTEEPEIDARGHRCPVPTLRLRRAVEAAPAGTVVRLLADDPMARVDVPHFASEAKVELLAVDPLPGGGWAFRVRAGARASE
jgi:tRNA 2-thiouridine synthesizing protein A